MVSEWLGSIGGRPADLLIFAAYLALASTIFILGAALRPRLLRYCETSVFDGTEAARKLAHVLCAGFTATFPYSGASYLVGVAMGGSTLILFQLLRRSVEVGPLGYLFQRRGGTKAFAAGVVCMSLLCYGHPAVFAVSFLILAFADPLAAWVGMSVKSRPLLRKSAGGFLAHAGVAGGILLVFFSAILHLSPAVSVFGALGIALVLSCVEATSTGGYDNLTVPLASYFSIEVFLHWL